MLAWGRKVSPEFRQRVREICASLGIADASWLMACMAFETGRSFSPSVRNGAGSGAVGLIQFMPQTASALGTMTHVLGAMTAVRQLDYVEAYFRPWSGRLRNLGDVYCAILWPAGIGKLDSAVLFSQASRPTTYLQNRGLDINGDRSVTRAEVTRHVTALLGEGMLAANASE